MGPGRPWQASSWGCRPYASLALAYGRQPQLEACQGRPGPIVGCGLSGEAVGELVVSAVLEKPPHRPDVPAITPTELQAVPAVLPAQRVAPFQNCVPRTHRGGRVGIAKSGITLDVEPWSAVRVGSAKADALNAQLRHDIVV